VHSEIEKLVITLLVMRSFSVLLGAPRACLDFREPTAVFRFMHESSSSQRKWDPMSFLSKNIRKHTLRLREWAFPD